MKYSKILRFLMSNVMHYVDDPAGGGGAPSPAPAATPAATPAPAAAAAPAPTPAPAASKVANPMLEAPLDELPAEWREHARELRRENANLRALAKAAEEKAAQEKMTADAKAAAAEETKALLQKEREASSKRIINSEVRSAATALGLQDPDTLKLLDTSKLTINEETGEVAGVTELLAEFKKNKPFLFKEPPVDTTQSRKTPDKSGAKPFDARTATADERAADAKSRGLQLKQH